MATGFAAAYAAASSVNGELARGLLQLHYNYVSMVAVEEYLYALGIYAQMFINYKVTVTSRQLCSCVKFTVADDCCPCVSLHTSPPQFRLP